MISGLSSLLFCGINGQFPSFFMLYICIVSEMRFFHINVTQNSGVQYDSHNTTDIKMSSPQDQVSQVDARQRGWTPKIYHFKGSKEEL